jgi:hypothetical protein
MPYATRDELYLLALGAPAFVVYARPFDAVDAATATIRLKGHGLSLSDLITFETSDGGRTPSGITQFATYYPVPVSSDLFRVAIVSGGATVTSWVDSGEGWAVAVDPGRRLDAHLLETAAFIDEHLTAHEPPIDVDPISGKYPPVLVGMNARLAARKAIASLEADNPQYARAIDRLLASEAADQIILTDWKNGKPINPRPTDGTATADNSARAQSGRCAMPWTTGSI